MCKNHLLIKKHQKHNRKEHNRIQQSNELARFQILIFVQKKTSRKLTK